MKGEIKLLKDILDFGKMIGANLDVWLFFVSIDLAHGKNPIVYLKSRVHCVNY